MSKDRPANRTKNESSAATDKVACAELDWTSENRDRSAPAPRSRRFDDIYFAGNGLAETRHVFLDGNDLAQRFQTQRHFSIGETGFGSGLNFLATLALWRDVVKPAHAHLDYVSCELFPLSTADLARAHGAWPELSPLADRLQRAYPPIVSGFHRLRITDDVTLTLIFDEAAAALNAINANIDAWFLDGFAPSKNPDMWRTEIFNRVASASAPGATFATFTVAGDVRRGLADAGFELTRKPGFGRKREMLTGRIEKPRPRAPSPKPWFDPPKASTVRVQRVAVIGAGIAGASVAHALIRRGRQVVAFDPDGPAAGASGNPGGLIMPRLGLADTPAARFFRQAYLFALASLRDLEMGKEVFNPCSVELRAADDAERARQAKLIAAEVLPTEMMTPTQSGLVFPQAGVVDPKAYVAALFGDTQIEPASVQAITPHPDHVEIIVGGKPQTFDAVVIANGRDALRFSPARTLPLCGVAGQLDWTVSPITKDAAAEKAIAAGPYIAPLSDGRIMFGATYDKIAADDLPETSFDATARNLAAAKGLAPGFVAGETTARASVRCQTPDRLPIVGSAPDWCQFAGDYDDLRFGKTQEYPPGERVSGVYFLTGLGSRGLVTAPLAAEIIAAMIEGAPSPVSRDVLEILHPGRFFIRELKRARTMKPVNRTTV